MGSDAYASVVDPAGGYYQSYAPGTYPGSPTGVAGAGGGGGGAMQGGIASALNAVEGIAGAGTRRQLEKTVKSLTNSACFFLFPCGFLTKWNWT